MRQVGGGKAAGGLLLLGSLSLLTPSLTGAYSIGDFQKSPAFVTTPVQPLVMLVLDNSISMDGLNYTDTYSATGTYYGFFESNASAASDTYYYHPLATVTSYACNYDVDSPDCSVPATTGQCTYNQKVCAYTANTVYTCKSATTNAGTGEYLTSALCVASGCPSARCVVAYKCSKNSTLWGSNVCGTNTSNCKSDAATCLKDTIVKTASTSTQDCSTSSGVTTCTSAPYSGSCVLKSPVTPFTLSGNYPSPITATCSDYGVTATQGPNTHPALTEAACVAAGGTYTHNYSAATPISLASCSGTDLSTCEARLNGECETSISTGTSRATYWRKTPTTPPGQNCTSGAECTGTGASVTRGNKLNHDYMDRLDIAKVVLTGGKTIPPPAGFPYEIDGQNADLVLEPGAPAPVGIIQDYDTLSWGYTEFSGTSGGTVLQPINSTNDSIVAAVNAAGATSSTPMAEALNTVTNYFRQVSPEYGPYTCVSSGTTGSGKYTTLALCQAACTGGSTCKREYLLGTYGASSNGWDPFYNTTTQSYVPCGHASAILITDGEPNGDDTFNAAVKIAAAGIEGNIPTAPTMSDTTSPYPTFYLDDVVYWAHTNDLRTDAAMGGKQTLDFYAIYTGTTAASYSNDTINAMKGAAKLGGFIDKNGNNQPNSVAAEAAAGEDMKEWDFKNADGSTGHDGIPDNYATAEAGEQLAEKLKDMLGQIQSRVSAGSAASVVSASRSGDGAIYQAIFYPKTPPDASSRRIYWAGDLHALWLDDWGNMREDCLSSDTGDSCTGSDGVLNLKTDKIVETYTSDTGETRVRLYRDTNGDSHYISGAGSVDYIGEMSLKSFSRYLWSGGRWLANAAADQKTYDSTSAARYIFTQKEVSGVPTTVAFTAAAMNAGFGASYASYLNASGTTEADKIVNYVRGVDDLINYRSRLYDWGWGDGAKTNKLGDIVGSTPQVVAKPAESYDMMYADKSYQAFRQQYVNRRTMVYAGANDGGLHAFNGGYFNRTTKQYQKGPDGKVAYDLGAEMWMFVPKNLLPHLKWLTDPNYSHVFYVDVKPYVFDAKIFTPDATHPHGWGTVLVGGMGFGGGPMTVGGATFRSAYFILDVTDPENPPVVLGEFTDASLGFTLAAPTAVPMLLCNSKVKGLSDSCSGDDWPMSWYLAFGSGPYDPANTLNALDGKSTQEAKVYLLKLGGTGGAALPYVSSGPTVLNVPSLVSGYPKIIPSGTTTKPAGFSKSFFSDMIAVDFDVDFKTDVMYFGSVANTDKAAASYYTGGLHRLVTGENSDPTTWALNTMFNAAMPVVAAPSAAYDGNRAWVFFGTGRLLDQNDKADTNPQTYFGLKESYDSSGQLQLTASNGGNLVDVSSVWVKKGTGELYDSATNAAAVIKSTDGTTLSAKTFKQLDLEIGEKQSSSLDKYNGWKLNFPRSMEKNLGQAALYGGILTFTTYVPSSEICSAEGNGYLWALYFRTGIAYFTPVIGLGSRGGGGEVLRETPLGAGIPAPPTLRVSANGVDSYTQTGGGKLQKMHIDSPGVIKSGVVSWRDKGAD